MYLHDQSQKITHFENNVVCLDFIDPLKNYPFHQSPSKTVHILEIGCKEILCIEYYSCGRDIYISFRCEISMNTLISDEMVMHFGNWPIKKDILLIFNVTFLFYYH